MPFFANLRTQLPKLPEATLDEVLIPLAAVFKRALGTFFPVFNVAPETVMMQVAAALAVGVLAGILPALRASRVRIVEGLRYIG